MSSSGEILEPCPFCGCEDVRIARGPMFGTEIVRCPECGMAAYMQGPGDVAEGWNERAGGGAASTRGPTGRRSTGWSRRRRHSPDGGRLMSEHGTRSAYNGGCRCDDCRRANREYEAARVRRKLYGRELLCDAAPVREHVERLHAAGIGYREIAELAGVSRSWLHTLRVKHASTGEPVRRCSAANARRVLAVRGRALRARTLVPAKPAEVIVKRLVQAGLSVAEIARATGLDRQILDALRHGRRERVTARTLGLIVKHREELRNRAPHAIERWTWPHGRRAGDGKG